MRRFSAAVTCLALTPVLGGLAACSGSDPAPASTSSSGSGVKKDAGAAAEALTPGTLATFLLEGVVAGIGTQGYDFLSDLLFGSGDVKDTATTEKLDGIQTQLDQINSRLDTIDTDLKSIQGQLANDQLGTKLDTMNGWNNRMRSLYREYFLPIATAAENVTVAKKNIADAQNASCATATSTATATATPTGTATSTGTACSTAAVPTALTDALAASTTALQEKKAAFNTAFMQADPYTVFADQHDELYPNNANVSSALKLTGRALESKGYATWTDSQRLTAMYLTLSDQEALTALLILEHDKMFGADAATLTRHKNEYVNNLAVEKANLAPEIPWAHVKVGAAEYMVPSYPQDTSHGPWLPISPDGLQLGTYDPLAKETENPGWFLPTDAQMTALYNATKNTTIVNSYVGINDMGPTTHLGSIWSNSGKTGSLAPHRILAEQEAMVDWGRPAFWTKDSGLTNPMTCIVGQYRTVYRQYTHHHMAVFSGSTAVGIQGQPGRIPDTAQGSPSTEAQCDKTLIALYNNDTYAADVMLTQPIPADVDYMAQRSTALPAPTPSTPSTPSS